MNGTESLMTSRTENHRLAGEAPRETTKRILFIEAARGMGGSVINVLYPMVTGLDRSRFTPQVLFYWPHPYQEKLEYAGVETLVFDKPRRVEHSTAITRLQADQASFFSTLRTGQTWRREFYHAVGSYVRLGYVLPQVARLAQIMKACSADLIHLNRDAGVEGREVVLAAKLAGLPVLCYAQNFSKFFAADRAIASLVDYYVFCSQAIGQHCLAHVGAKSGQTAVIYPGVDDVERWSRPYDVAEIRRSCGWSPDDFVVGNFGRLVEWKGQEIFVRALAEVKRHVPEVKGLIVGGEPTSSGSNQPSYFERLKALVSELDLTRNVHFTGFRADMPALMASIDILAHSSIEPEPFATTVIEGMMAGRAVIAANAGGMPEMVSQDVTGLLVPPRDSQALAHAIRQYYGDRDRARQMALAGQHFAQTRLTARRHIDEFQALYERIFGRDAGATEQTPHSVEALC